MVQSSLWLFADNSKIFRSITSIEDSNYITEVNNYACMYAVATTIYSGEHSGVDLGFSERGANHSGSLKQWVWGAPQKL